MIATELLSKEAPQDARKEAESAPHRSDSPDRPAPDHRAPDRWQLTEESLSALLEALAPTEPQAVERYQRLHERLVFFFMRHRAIHPEDLADIAINRLARKLADGDSIDNVEAYALGVARMVQCEDQAGSLRHQRIVTEWTRNESLSAPTSHEDEDKLDIMEEHFSALPQSSQEMLSSYHLGRGTARIQRRQQLANDLGISIGTLRKRVFDLQAQLRLRFEKGRELSLQPQEEPEHS